MNDTPMLLAIAAAPIVSSGTLRPDHLCRALIAEADRLEIVLQRSLWQPAAAIAAHGQYQPGIVLELPSRLEEISGEIVAELFDALNWAAPSGCSLEATEGDGACFMWHLTMEASAEAINTDKSRFEAKTLEIPEHWLPAIVNCDDSGLSDKESAQLEAFCRDELCEGWDVTAWEEEGSFCTYHDAQPYGTLACDAVTVLAMRQKPAMLAA